MIATDKDLDLKVHTRLEDIDPAEWDALVLQMREPAIYHSHDWARLWLKHFGEGIAPRIFAVREGGKLIGLLPMLVASQRIKIFSRRRLAPLSSASAPAPQYLGPICDPEHENECIELMARELLKTRDADAIYFEHFLPGQPAEKLVDRLAATRNAIRWTGETTYWVPLAETFEAFWETLPRKLKKNIVSARNRFASTEGARIEPVTNKEGVEAAVEAFRRHSIARLGDKGIDSTLNDRRMADFFGNLARASFERDRAICFGAWLGDKCIGTIFGLSMGAYLCYYNGSFDPEHSNLSPGTLLIDTLCKEAIAKGHRKLDMLAGFGEYKHRWAGENCAKLQHATVPLGSIKNLPFTIWERMKAKKSGRETHEDHEKQ
ncbi:GNAT family N-acetyltransferase [bacterium]|nr:GNAT family N-acetyltransferase [bacterium]